MLSPADETIIREAALYLEHLDTGFVFIEVNEPDRQEFLAGYLEQHLAKKTIIVDFERISPVTFHLDEIQKQVATNPGAEILLILNLHTLAREIKNREEGLVRDLNFSREPYTQLERALVFFFPTYFVDLIIRGARDFFDFVPMDFKFPPEKTAAFERIDPTREMADERFLRNRAAFLESILLSNTMTEAERADKLFDLADTFRKLYLYDKSLDYYQECLDLSRKLANKRLTAVTLNQIGLIFLNKGDYDTALRHLEKSLKIRRKIGDKQGEGATLNNIGQIYYYRGDYDTALRYLEQSLNICREIGNKQGEGVALNDIGQIYYYRGDYDTALHHLEESLKISQEIGDKRNEGVTLNNICTIYHARGDDDTALRHLEESLKISQEIGDKRDEGVMLSNISQIYDVRGDYDTALRLLEQSLKISQEIGYKQGESITLFNIAAIFERKNNIKKAIELMERVVAIDQELSLPDLDNDMDFLNRLKGKK